MVEAHQLTDLTMKMKKLPSVSNLLPVTALRTKQKLHIINYSSDI